VPFQSKPWIGGIEAVHQFGQEHGVRVVGRPAFVKGLLQIFKVGHQLRAVLGGHVWPERWAGLQRSRQRPRPARGQR
jgi:hypothetical protein